eukprot:scaffold141634_cov35-Tisochrysis_lutea.AAC.3
MGLATPRLACNTPGPIVVATGHEEGSTAAPDHTRKSPAQNQNGVGESTWVSRGLCSVLREKTAGCAHEPASRFHLPDALFRRGWQWPLTSRPCRAGERSRLHTHPQSSRRRRPQCSCGGAHRRAVGRVRAGRRRRARH